MFSIFAKGSILDVRLGSTNVLSKKMNVFFDGEHFCLHWNHSQIEKCVNVGGRRKFQENRRSIVHSNTFIKIGSINNFKSWLLVIKLVDRCVPFLPTLPEKLLPQPPDLLLYQDISHFCRFLKELIILIELISISYGKSCYHYQISYRNTVYKEAASLW